MWAGRMRGHAEPLVTTLGTQRNSQKYFGVYYSELKNAQKRKRKRAEWQGDRRDGGDRKRRKERKGGEWDGVRRDEGKQAEHGVAGALWSSVGEKKEDCWGLGSVLFEGAGRKRFPASAQAAKNSSVSALNSTRVTLTD